MEVISARQQTSDVKMVSVRFVDPNGGTGFFFPVGQFGIFAAFGDGESTFNPLLQLEVEGSHRLRLSRSSRIFGSVRQ